MSSHTHQLVLQLPSAVLDGFDDLISLEEALIEACRGQWHTVDGHDLGSGEVNFFIHTSDPEKAFAAAIDVFEPAERRALRAAFRLLDGAEYTTIWPRGSQERFELR